MMPDPQRVAQIAAMLPEKPRGLGEPIDNREHWDALAKSKEFEFWVTSVEKDLDQKVAYLSEDFYREVAESGSRPAWYGFDHPRSNRLRRLAIAECLDNKGRFLPALEQALDAVLSEKTWFIPLYGKGSIANWEGRMNSIDLYKAMRSWEIATIDWLLRSRLKPETHQRIRQNLERRTFDSIRKSLSGEHKADWWFKTTNNWNAVCLAGPVGAALTMIDSREDRALFVAAAEKHIHSFISGYPEDGYCTEGMGYYNFGFGHFLYLTEVVYQATGGKLDFLQLDPNIRNMSLYPARIEIMNGTYPAFADCSPNSRPNSQILYYTSRRLGLGIEEWDNIPLSRRVRGKLYQTLLNVFPNSADAMAPAKERTASAGKRSYFDSVGILVCRPGEGSQAKMGVALKGGHNAEHHNHNDVGAFVVAVGAEAPICDVGAVIYTKYTFSSRRYEEKAINSFGHSAPVVAGQLQIPGREAAAKVLKTDFTDDTDTIVMDLAAAYQVEGLEKLERVFTYSRKGEGSLTMTDQFAYASPQLFETAIMTLGGAEKTGPASILFYDKRQAVRADIEAPGAEIAIRIEALDVNLRGSNKATRVAIALAQPAASGTVTVRIAPTDHPHWKEGQGILNGDFEQKLELWAIKERETMTFLSTNEVASGKYALHVVDKDKKLGSSAFSQPMTMVAGREYELCGKFRPVSGKDLGVVTRFYDAGDRILDLPDDKRRLCGTVKLGGDEGEWRTFTKRFTAPEGTHFARIWVHSFSAATVEGYLDDLEIAEVEE